MKTLDSKFDTLIRKLNYDQIKFTYLDVSKIEEYFKRQMPGVVEELVKQKWDLTNDDTWLTNSFCDHLLRWYGKKISIFLTNSWQDYNLFRKVIEYPKFKKFRKVFGIDMQVCLLTSSVIFLKPEDLDTIHLNFDFSKDWCCLDISGFDSEDNTVEEEWSYLESEGASQDQLVNTNWDEEIGDGWSVEEVSRAYKQKVYKNSL